MLIYDRRVFALKVNTYVYMYYERTIIWIEVDRIYIHRYRPNDLCIPLFGIHRLIVSVSGSYEYVFEQDTIQDAIHDDTISGNGIQEALY